MAAGQGFGAQWEDDTELLKEAHRQVGSRIPAMHLPQLAGLPESWRLCGTGNRGNVKDCFETSWNSDPAKRYTALQLLTKNGSFVQKCIGAGVQTGPASGGLLVLDFDEPDDLALDGMAEETFQGVFGKPSSELPTTATNASGRRGRRKVFLMVPEDWWPVLGNWSFAAGPYADKKKHAFEAIWLNGTGSARQALIAGDHPKGTAENPLYYHWIDGLHPAVVGVAVAPPWVIGGFIRQVQKGRETKETQQADSFQAQREAGEPQPCDLLLPKDQRRLLVEMQKFWPYRGAPSDSPQAASYLTQFRPLVAGLLNVLGKATVIEWLGGGQWDRRNDWKDGNIGSLEELLTSLGRSATDGEKKCGWGSVVKAAIDGGFEFPKWALPPKEVDVEDFQLQSIKKVQRLRQALEVIDGMPSPTERLSATQELTRIVGCKDTEMAQLIRCMQEEDSQAADMNGTLEQVLANAKPITPAIDNLLASGAVTLVASEGGVGKSVLIYRLAEAVANGAKFAGQLQAVQGKVLVIQRDESSSNAAQKLRLMDMSVPADSIHFKFQFHGGMYPELKKWIKELEVAVVVMDSFGSLFAGGDAGMSEAEAGLHLYRLNDIASEMGVAIVLTHHLRKQGKDKGGQRKDVFLSDLFGSSYIVNGASDVWGVIRDPEASNPTFLLKVLKPRTGITEAGDTYRLLGNREDLSLVLDSHNGDQEGLKRLKGLHQKVVELLSGRSEETALDVGEISGLVSSHRNVVERVVRSLVSDQWPGLQRVKRGDGGRGPKPYVYWVEEGGTVGGDG